MPKRTDIKKILVIGSGPIVIGQAAEFDYAGTQACLALREEGYEVVLCNSNPATIMTDRFIADKVYMEPLTLEYMAKIIRCERPDAILPGIGGQTGLNLAVRLEKEGIPVSDINVGGGLGIEYEHPNHFPMADFAAYFGTYKRGLRGSRPVHFELGRAIIAPCGTLITRVLYVKEGLAKRFAIVDAGMNDLVRPAMYHAVHRIENLSSDGPELSYDVVGPCCESSDVFGKDILLNECHRGDIIAIRSAGAYGQSMASQYNCRPLAPAYFSE